MSSGERWKREGDEPHIEGDAQEDDGQRHSEYTKPAHSHRALTWVTSGRPSHFVQLKLIHCNQIITKRRMADVLAIGGLLC